MSTSMAEGIAEVLSAHVVIVGGLMMPTGWCSTCGHLEDGDQENHQAEQLAANGYGKLEDAKAAALREAALELMNISEHPLRMPGIRFAVGFLAGQRVSE